MRVLRGSLYWSEPLSVWMRLVRSPVQSVIGHSLVQCVVLLYCGVRPDAGELGVSWLCTHVVRRLSPAWITSTGQ
jgi:hypothetical protein